MQPQHCFSDGYEAYKSLLYPQGQHAVAPGKSQTYSVEGDNADLRFYLEYPKLKARLIDLLPA